MTKEKVLADFLQALKTVLNIAALYSKDHPYFLKAIEDFRKKIDPVFQFLDSLRIDVTPSSVFLEDKELPSSPNSREIAGILHRRKIKKVEIRKDVGNKELAHFIHSISLRPREILSAGGISEFVSKGQVKNISVEELDYSELLKGGREEIADIWSYLLEEAVGEVDGRKINDLADNFSRIISQFKINDFISDEGVSRNLAKFFEYLKVHEKSKFQKCSQDFFRMIISDKGFSDYQKLDKIKLFLGELKDDDIAAALLEQLSKDKEFDIHNLNLFSLLFSGQRHQKIASCLGEKIEHIEYLRDKTAAKDKLQELFSSADASSISEIYQNTLTHLLGGISFKDKYDFDQDLIVENYELTLLEILNSEIGKDLIIQTAKRIGQEFDNLVSRREWEYLKHLVKILSRRKISDSSFGDSIKALDIKLTNLLESMIWDEKKAAEIVFLEDYCQASTKWPEFYLDNIFKEEVFTPGALKLYFRFFPKSAGLFYGYLDKKRSQLKFLAALITNLSSVQTESLLATLKYIYGISDTLIKVEVLKAMQSAQAVDSDFLLEVIEENNFALRKEAMSIIKKDVNLAKQALDKLLLIKNPFGLKNRIILDNLRIVQELNLQQARDQLLAFSKMRFFWYRQLKDKAKKIMDGWHDRNN